MNKTILSTDSVQRYAEGDKTAYSLKLKAVFDTIFCEALCYNAFGLAGSLGLFENTVNGIEDVVYLLENILFVVGGEGFLACVDNAAAVDDEIGSIEDAFALEHSAAFFIKKLVVCSACDCAALKVRDGVIVESCTESAGGDNIALCFVDLAVFNFLCAERKHIFHILAV